MPIVPLWLRLVLLGGVILLLVGALKGCHDSLVGKGRALERADWIARGLQESQAKAKEGFRRSERQEENQRAQDAEVARLRDAAARNAADADRVRQQAVDNARAWAQRLADSPAPEDLTAAAAAIAVCTDVRGRLDQAAGVFAAHAGASRAAGLKCEADYDALTGGKP